MSCEVAALPFQAHANYRIWSINFDIIHIITYLLIKLPELTFPFSLRSFLFSPDLSKIRRLLILIFFR